MNPTVGQHFAAARSAWLHDTTTRLERDRRAVAVLVTGSLGRGTADDWSDIDLVVVLARRVDADLLANRDEFVRSFGAAVFVFDSPWNAPLDGAQVNVLYDLGGDWPLYVDWDLWPRNRGAISPDVRVVFDRAGLPITTEPFDEHRSWPRSRRPEPTSGHLQRARIAMLPIIAKCLVRGDLGRAQRMLSNLGYETRPTAIDLLETTETMWADVRIDAGDGLAPAIERMLVSASGTLKR